MSDVSEAFDTIIEATKYAEDTGNQDLADSLGNAYQVLGDEVLADVMPSDAQHTISESADKIVVKTKVKRGTGTRDEDKIDVKVKGDNPTEVVEKVNETISRLHNTADDLRSMQPENDD